MPDAGEDAPSDQELLRRHVAGDSDAFGELFRRHRDRLWAVALRTVCDPDEASDALQDAMVSAFRRAADFRGESAVTTWLHRIVVNASLDRLRRRAARPALSAGDEQAFEALVAQDGDPARAVDTRLDVDAALRILPPPQRAALVVVDMLGFSVADAAAILVFAASNPEGGVAGVDGFIVPREASGLTISGREQNMGIKGLATFGLTLQDCRIEADARLGGEQGINFVRLLSESRVAIAAMAVGVARAAYEYACEYAKERKAFGVAIATKQAIAFMLAEMAIEVDAARLLVWEAASRLDKGEDGLKESYQARNYAAQAALTVTDNAVQVLGGHGYIREHPVELWLRNARGFAVLEGLAIV